MDLSGDRQQLEITALKSIYDENFIECPPPKAWKGAARLPEFIIKVHHPEEKYANNVCFDLHVRFPKTYPSLACPIFTIQRPINGLKPDEVTKLSNAIHAEAQSNKGTEVVFQIVTFAQDWILSHITPRAEVKGSLAAQMKMRAMAEEEARRQQEEAEHEREQERAVQMMEEFQAELRADAERQQHEKEFVQRARRRAVSEATEIPLGDALLDNTPIESFQEEIQWQGVSFMAVKLFHPKKECLGTIWQAEPAVEDPTDFQLEVFIVNFEARYYTTSQGRKKLKLLESEIQRLCSIRHNNLLAVLAVKLVVPHSGGAPKLVILCEARPSVTLDDVLQDCDFIREDRATEYLTQILSGLNAIHTVDLIHRGLVLKWIGLAPGRHPGEPKQVKIFKVAYQVRLLDMHRSEPFGPNAINRHEDLPWNEAWLPKEALDSPLIYTRARDIHAAGIILLQMLLGRDVTDRYPDTHAALMSAMMSPLMQQMAVNMLTSLKRNVSCFSLLAELAGAPISNSNGKSSPAIPISGPRTPMPHHQLYGSPESDYFRAPPPPPRSLSRWKEDWEELELLGKGAFGSVVKARNKIDNLTYAVKKIKLRATPNDTKIFREVNALSRLNHRFIVRYYTTWVETSELASTAASSANSDSGTSVPNSRDGTRSGHSNLLTFNMDDLGSNESHHSFPSIRFTRSGTPESSSTDIDSDEVFDEDPFLNSGLRLGRSSPALPAPLGSRTLYIQMEYVERQTLKERIAEGISESEAWRLFQQIVEALVHMANLGILHRDIKLTNIFIDVNGDCKVGDFGLATSSLAAVDPSDLTIAVPRDAEMTLDVGTKLYIAPEVQSNKGGYRNHAKADIYSLGIVFFEMNYTFSTGAERIDVLEGLRKPAIFFPQTWEARRSRQKQIITWLLQHNPNDRPTALELSQSQLLPPKMEDEYFKNALKMMAKPDSPHYQAVLSTLFGQPPKPTRGFLYDSDIDLPSSNHITLNGVVRDRIVQLFRLHGAVEMEPTLLLPHITAEDDQSKATFLDKHGEVVSLPSTMLAPFARLAARENTIRIKRFYIGDIYRPIMTPGHPKTSKAAVFDIITPDVVHGQPAATAEALSLAHSCLECFANLGAYEIRISHSKIYDLALGRVPPDLRAEVIKVLDQPKSSQSQKRSILLRKGIPRNTVDELEVLLESDEDVDAIVSRLERVSPQLLALLSGPINDIKATIHFASISGVTRPIYFFPLYMLAAPTHPFKDGVCFEVVRHTKRSDVLAFGGRYDHMISRHAPPKPKSDPICAIAVQISVEKITLALAAFQSTLKESGSYGYWTPRRCDVYIVSHQEGYLLDRLELASFLWQNNISADLMYEFALTTSERENVIEQCAREGILFIVYPRPRTARRDQPAFKVKSVLKGTEDEMSRQELVPFLLQQLAEQKRIDAPLSGVPALADGPSVGTTTKDATSSADISLLLPGDAKKLRKQTKQIFLDRAFEFGVDFKNTLTHPGIPILGVDIPLFVFEEMSKNANWVTDDDAWKHLLTGFPTAHLSYAHQVREAVTRRKQDGIKFVILFAVREERVSLLVLA